MLLRLTFNSHPSGFGDHRGRPRGDHDAGRIGDRPARSRRSRQRHRAAPSGTTAPCRRQRRTGSISRERAIQMDRACLLGLSTLHPLNRCSYWVTASNSHKCGARPNSILWRRHSRRGSAIPARSTSLEGWIRLRCPSFRSLRRIDSAPFSWGWRVRMRLTDSSLSHGHPTARDIMLPRHAEDDAVSHDTR